MLFIVPMDGIDFNVSIVAMLKFLVKIIYKCTLLVYVKSN